MPGSHDVEIDMLGLVREEQTRWYRLAFLAEEVEWARRHLETEVADARDQGWSWRRLGAATGIPAETLRYRGERPQLDPEPSDEDAVAHQGGQGAMVSGSSEGSAVGLTSTPRPR